MIDKKAYYHIKAAEYQLMQIFALSKDSIAKDFSITALFHLFDAQAELGIPSKYEKCYDRERRKVKESIYK